MVAHVYTSQQRTRSLIAVISAVFATGVAVGALVPLIFLRMEREGFSSFVIGVNALMLPLAVMMAGPFVPKLAARFGTLNAIYLSTAVLSGLTLSLPFLPIMPAWFVVRFLEGVAAAVGWIITETWVNLMATESNRTRVIAVVGSIPSSIRSRAPIVPARPSPPRQ